MEIEIRKDLPIDLHTHSTFSDGTDTPEALRAKVAEMGLLFFSVTDHDDIGAAQVLGCAGRSKTKASAGMAPALNGESGSKSGKPANVAQENTNPTPEFPIFISGAEFSAEDEKGKYHILAYDYDPEAISIRTLAEMLHQRRLDKIRLRLQVLAEDYGIVMPPEDREELMALRNPGKPHIARWMVEQGIVRDSAEAFARYLNVIRVPSPKLDPAMAIEAIRMAGGIPVLAHPTRGDGCQVVRGQDLEERVERLQEMGLMGIEGYYSEFSKEERDEVLALAERKKLYVTAGSDYHGTNKPNVLGDTGMAKACAGGVAPAEGLYLFLEAVLPGRKKDQV